MGCWVVAWVPSINVYSCLRTVTVWLDWNTELDSAAGVCKQGLRMQAGCVAGG